jgi:hypothetical protein
MIFFIFKNTKISEEIKDKSEERRKELGLRSEK